MSKFKINSITDRSGYCGPVISGVSTNNSTGCMIIPAGPTEYRGGRDRGIHGGGTTSPTLQNVIDYITISTLGDALDFGDLTQARHQVGACGGYTRGHFNGGSLSPNPNSDRMDYVIFSSKGGAADWGELSVARSTYAATSNGKRGLIYGGTPPSNNNLIEYFNMATQGSASGFGDQIYNQREQGCLENSIRSVVAGGWGDPTSPFQGNTAPIRFISFNLFETLGSTVHFGELNNSVYGVMGAASQTRGLFAGGWSPTSPNQINVIDYITIATEGDAVDFGDTTAVRHSGGGTSNNVRGIFSGGYNPSLLATIDYVTIATTGNAADFGDLTVARFGGRMCSDCHGGLS